ncbi:MAG: patatin-like phospholipase family protein [Candidatus Zixiibacteriota bacterium]|nr:MAG: patatin-like phospholipase family protein [candidate division Zixibacteria bacterium]
MKALVLSGGASKGAFTAGVVRYLIRKKKMEFDVAVGTSTGSLVAGPALLGDHAYCRDVYVSVNDKDIFQNSLIGKIATAISHFVDFISGPIDARLDPLRKILEDYYYGEEKLDQLLDSGKEMLVSVANVRTGKIQFVSSNQVKNGDIDEDTFISAIVSSCSEPFFTKPVQIFEKEENHPNCKDLFYDGGVKEFLPIEKAVSLGAEEIWAVSTHPLEFQITEWGGNTAAEDVSFLKALAWTVGAFSDEVVRGDYYRAWTYFHWSKIIKLMKKEAPQLLNKPEVKDFLFGLSLPILHIIYPKDHLATSLQFEPATMWKYWLMGERRAKKMIEENATEISDENIKPWQLHQG